MCMIQGLNFLRFVLFLFLYLLFLYLMYGIVKSRSVPSSVGYNLITLGQSILAYDTPSHCVNIVVCSPVKGVVCYIAHRGRRDLDRLYCTGPGVLPVGQ